MTRPKLLSTRTSFTSVSRLIHLSSQNQISAVIIPVIASAKNDRIGIRKKAARAPESTPPDTHQKKATMIERRGRWLSSTQPMMMRPIPNCASQPMFAW